MPHLPLVTWDFAERMQTSSTQVFGEGTPETTYYVYDASGQRVRKVTERQAATIQTPTRMKERDLCRRFRDLSRVPDRWYHDGFRTPDITHHGRPTAHRTRQKPRRWMPAQRSRLPSRSCATSSAII